MAEISEQLRQSDVTAWGIAALACVGLAVVTANVAGLVPAGGLAALHVPRGEAGSMAQLRQQVAQLQADTVQLRRQNEMLNTRFSLQEQTGSEVIRRVGALEVAVPTLLEGAPLRSMVDRSVTTASIGESKAEQFAADGGTVSVRHTPMPQPIAEATQTASGAEVGYGVVLGPSFAPGHAGAQWHDMEVRLGSILSEMSPLIGKGAADHQQRLVVGPLDQMAQARDLCQRLEPMDIACTPTTYSGEALIR